MDAGSELRHLIWDLMLTADLNGRYYGYLATRYRSADHWAKVFVAITSSTAVSGWALWGTPGLDWIWKAASAAATLVAIALPIFDPANSMKTASRLTGAWYSILSDYSLLWTQVDEASESLVRKRCQAIMAEERPLAELEATLPKHRRLILHCEAEVRRARELPPD